MTSRLADVEQTLDLPPGYTLVALRELGDAFAHGCEIAAEAGAGTLVWVRRYDLVEFAVVLEPDEAAGLGAPGVLCRHECAGRRDLVALPARAGGQFRLARRRSGSTAGCWAAPGSAGPTDCAEDEIPAWLVFGVILRAADMAHIEEVQAASGVALLSEGFEMIDTDAIIESFARHLMTGVRPMAGARVRAGRAELSGAACAGQGRRTPRHRRQWRSAGASRRRQGAAGTDQPRRGAGAGGLV